MDEVRGTIEEFILDSLLLGDDSRMPSATDSLVETGVIDSTGILELIEFLESEFGVHVEDSETVPENLDGIDRLTAFVVRKAGEVVS
ncbi:MAG: acyl carrier protein [Propionicimonas sp.]|nr:acyl carrier protein [Propionicimonas sp.]